MTVQFHRGDALHVLASIPDESVDSIVMVCPGLIDSGYRGEVQVALVNTDPDIPFVVRRGDRIAQVMFQWLERPEWLEVDRLDETERGSRGFGSSGL